MKDQNKTRLIIGLVFIIISFICVTAIFYFMMDTNTISLDKVARLEVQLANLIAEKSEKQMRRSDFNLVKRDPINLDEFLDRSERYYGGQELNRKEGILWIDRGTSLCMITLGVINGLEKGHRLTIYDGDQKLGRVIVETPFDLVSYVKLSEKSLDDFKYNYYMVVRDDLP